MSLHFIIFIVLFLLTIGLASLGVLSAINLNNKLKKPEWQAIIYHQIFVYSFLIYSIWGNILAMELMRGLNLNPDLSGIISFFIPFLGMPFMILNWFMLIKFTFNISGKNLNKKFSAGYFIFFTLSMLIVTYLLRNNSFNMNHQPEVSV